MEDSFMLSIDQLKLKRGKILLGTGWPVEISSHAIRLFAIRGYLKL